MLGFIRCLFYTCCGDHTGVLLCCLDAVIYSNRCLSVKSVIVLGKAKLVMMSLFLFYILLYFGLLSVLFRML